MKMSKLVLIAVSLVLCSKAFCYAESLRDVVDNYTHKMQEERMTNSLRGIEMQLEQQNYNQRNYDYPIG